MKFIFDGYDLTLAVVYRRTLLFEYLDHNNQERAELVWQPTQLFFEGMAKENPKQITCFFGKQMHYPKERSCSIQYLYTINRHNEVACLGTAFNTAAIRHYPSTLSKQDAVIFRKYGSKKVWRGSLLHCVIPTEKEEINELALIKAAKKYFQGFEKKTLIPNLANALICLLSPEKGAWLEKEILAQAEKTAVHVSNKEQGKKLVEDQMW